MERGQLVNSAMELEHIGRVAPVLAPPHNIANRTGRRHSRALKTAATLAFWCTGPSGQQIGEPRAVERRVHSWRLAQRRRPQRFGL